jgi:hypothetical protein
LHIARRPAGDARQYLRWKLCAVGLPS